MAILVNLLNSQQADGNYPKFVRFGIVVLVQ